MTRRRWVTRWLFARRYHWWIQGHGPYPALRPIFFMSIQFSRDIGQNNRLVPPTLCDCRLPHHTIPSGKFWPDPPLVIVTFSHKCDVLPSWGNNHFVDVTSCTLRYVILMSNIPPPMTSCRLCRTETHPFPDALTVVASRDRGLMEDNFKALGNRFVLNRISLIRWISWI